MWDLLLAHGGLPMLAVRITVLSVRAWRTRRPTAAPDTRSGRVRSCWRRLEGGDAVEVAMEAVGLPGEALRWGTRVLTWVAVRVTGRVASGTQDGHGPNGQPASGAWPRVCTAGLGFF